MYRFLIIDFSYPILLSFQVLFKLLKDFNVGIYSLKTRKLNCITIQ